MSILMIGNRLQHIKVADILFVLLLFCIPMYVFNPKFVEKILYIIAMCSLYSLLKNRKKIKINFLALAFFMFGGVMLIWAYTQQGNSSEFLSTYRSYKDVGKITLAISIIVLALDSFSLKIKKVPVLIYLVVLVLCGLAVFTYPDNLLISGRLSINMPATGTAYILTFLSIAALALPKLNIFIRLLIFFSLFYCVLLTGTRAAILVMPVLLFIFFSFEFKKVNNKKIILLFFLISLISIAIFSKNMLIVRVNDALNDLTKYSHNDSNSSLGARFSMSEIGIKTGNNYLLGQSLESRLQGMQELAQNKPILQSSLMFADVNLHNDLIDAYSIRGIFGAVTYLLLIGLLLYRAYRNKNIYEFMFALATVAYGTSDMVFYGRNMIVMWGTCFIIISLCSYKQNIGNK
ncbi:O-antigen ligase family protein [Providencia rettgeri]|nr:O-antigen ligase family protein [Providencia rettgeri]NHN53107.1 O-antigen ligase family protein [Providencia rettgeri]